MDNQRVMDVGAVVDQARLQPVSALMLTACVMVATCDGFDNQALAFTAPAIAGDWGLQMADFVPVFSAGLFGLLLGSTVFGTFADRFGRRRLLIACTAVFGLATLATPFVHGPAALMLVRFIGGLGIGGVPSAGRPWWGIGAWRRVRTAQSLTHTVQRRTETGLASRIMRLSTWTASATSPC